MGEWVLAPFDLQWSLLNLRVVLFAEKVHWLLMPVRHPTGWDGVNDSSKHRSPDSRDGYNDALPKMPRRHGACDYYNAPN
jgi:hypothetical protein